MKDHEIAQIINQIRDIAIEFHGTQQLRERIAGVLRPILSEDTQIYNEVELENVWQDYILQYDCESSEWLDKGCDEIFKDGFRLGTSKG